MSTSKTTNVEIFKHRDLGDEMKDAFGEYAMSVVVERALPDARDGLKPVHRRILFAMHDGGYTHDKPTRKSARIVGDVIGKWHPHGDSAVYEAMVRMAQSFSLRLPLVEGQGNFGSMDGDSAAAMRYTESRLDKKGRWLVTDLNDQTVDWIPNYDGAELEPRTLPTRFPNLIINGSEGIAVGMATKMAPHNPGEAIDACLNYIKNPDMTVDQLMEIMPAPDFPTGAQIMGTDGVRQAYETGRGAVIMRAKHHIEEPKSKKRGAIVFTEIPYQINKATLVQQINDLKRNPDNKVDGIHEVRDESDRNGVRVVVELKSGADHNRLLAQLFKMTPLQTSFSMNMMAIDKGRPKLLSMLDLIRIFVDFRREVVTRRTRQELKQALKKGHLLLGLAAALDQIDLVIDTIRKADSGEDAREALKQITFKTGNIRELIDAVEGHRMDVTDTFQLDDDQVKAILDMRLHRLTGMERDKVLGDIKTEIDHIIFCRKILMDDVFRDEVVSNEMIEVREKVADERRSEICDAIVAIKEEDLVQKEDVIVCWSLGGYVKRVPLKEFKEQNRGGTGKIGMATKDDDALASIISTHTHAPMVIFTEDGMSYGLKVWQLPSAKPQDRGRPIVNFVNLTLQQKIAKSIVLPMNGDSVGKTLLFVTRNGGVRRNALSDFSNINAAGKIAMKLDDENGNRIDDIVDVLVCDDHDEIVLMTKNGMATRFDAEQIRVSKSRSGRGVRGIWVGHDDHVIAAAVVSQDRIATVENEEEALANKSEPCLMTITDKGFAKRTPLSAYNKINRGGKGLNDAPANKAKYGNIHSALVVEQDDNILIMTQQGQSLRTNSQQIGLRSRRATGVKLVKLRDGDVIVSAERVISKFPDELLLDEDDQQSA